MFDNFVETLALKIDEKEGDFKNNLGQNVPLEFRCSR